MTLIDGALSADAPDGVITSAGLRAAGLSSARVARHCLPGGPWRRLLPGVVMLGCGAPTRRQQLRAAILKFDGDAVVTGLDALCAHGALHPLPWGIHLLVPPHRRTEPGEFVVTQRTSRIPDPVLINGIPFAPAARAALDAARREGDPRRLKRLLRLPLYWGLCTKDELLAELDAGNQRGSAAVRAVLRQLDSSAGTFAHGMAKELLKSAPLPPPSWNVTICDLRGRQIAVADAWWDEIALAWLFTPPGKEMAGHGLTPLALKAAGVVVLRTPAEKLYEAPEEVRQEVVSAFGEALRRRRPKVQGLRDVRSDQAA
jgi:hypothetical protein